MRNYNRLINEMLGQIYEDEKLQKCIGETIRIRPERIFILHQIIMNRDCLSKEEIQELAYRYAKTIKADELLARQIFLCLLHLVEK